MNALESSPCVRNCSLDENDICLGCFRSLEEIKAWGNSPDDMRKEILESAEKRKMQRKNTTKLIF